MRDEGVKSMRSGKQAYMGEDLILLKGGRKMIRISKRAVEKLKETYQNRQKNLYRVFVSGMG
jgi:hypothetical protein